MRYAETPPAPPLEPYVRRFWALEDATPSALRAVERVVPDGCMELIVHLGPPFRRPGAPEAAALQPRALLAGQLRGALLLQPRQTIDFVAIRFQPWGARALLGVEPGALTDRLPALDDRVGWGARRLERAVAEHVGLAPKSPLRVGRVQRVLASLEAPGVPPLASLALDHRFADQAHLIREFTRLVGVPPARYRAEAHGLEDLILDAPSGDGAGGPYSRV